MNRTLKTSFTAVALTAPALFASASALAAEGGGSAMPQLDHTTFSSQIFWLVVSFAVLFILMWKIGIPRVGEVIEAREQKIRADLERAEQLHTEIVEAEAEVERALAAARSEAQDILRKAQEKILADHSKKQKKLDDELAKRVSEAEGRIDAARKDALASVRDVAKEVAMTSVEKLTGQSADTGAVDKALDNAAKGG